MEPRQQQFSLWYVLLAVTAMLILQSLFFSSHIETLPYSDFKVLLKAGKLKDITLGEGAITGTVNSDGIENLLPKQQVEEMQRQGKGDHPFSTLRVNDPNLVQDLEAAKVRFVGQADNKWISTLLSWVVPAMLFFAVWSFLIKRMGGAAGGMMEIGKSKAKVYMQKETGVTFADVAGVDEAKEELAEIVNFLKDPQRYRRLGGKIPKGVLLLGAPGTGKTLLAKAVAGEAGVPFFSMSGSEFVEMFVGVGAARVRDLFNQAETKAPCIIFIDELDALGKTRALGAVTGNDEREQTLNQLLVEMDGFDTNKGVIIMAATNRPEILDPALLRPGRFDRHVALDRPDLKGREQILKVHIKDVVLAPTVELTNLAARTPGFAGADLANLVNEAALLAARKGKDAVDMADFDEALDRIIGGLEKKNRVMNPQEKETIAYHEAGHAIVAESRPHADRVSKVSIIPRGVAALGYTQQTPTEDRYLLKQSELLDRLDVLLGGRMAEQIVYGDVSTGAQNDLQRATDMARQMITQFGMSEQLGLATYEDLPNPLYNSPGLLPRERKEYSESTAQIIDAEVRKILGDASQRVKQTLLANRHKLDALAKLLLEQEVVDRAALELLLSDKVATLTVGKPSSPDAAEARGSDKPPHENESRKPH
ncbi:cell division protease FtsH [Cupriavidus metallidurans]|jgi:cell division protease FtsH|uniref:ATP-dependent zinc metalloprotease FtsH n=1 Tax=Cupriavidus TaxID=106589 RepID=UPI0002A1DF88|nr:MULTISPECIES: ATP-dependent zinc metalloprotease FtsH [Cupriavidus]EKZ97915.1 FtsH-2 peptidase [Cupriavidus sp. HMR-1]KWR75534.1 cell division protein FtsH [Cupriavidus sp. SHE]MDE4920275.1 ATP-dependent zinc metalloprotease FtsH [Cupriavidus metallidurans]GMG95051.1 ATP-dependent zinc metalloprotease FtsH [Cupriavidus sp. TKC]